METVVINSIMETLLKIQKKVDYLCEEKKKNNLIRDAYKKMGLSDEDELLNWAKKVMEG